MIPLLRTISVAIGILVLLPFLFLAWHVIDLARRPSPRALLIVVPLVAFIGLSVFAMHRLWHLKQSGRWAALGVFGLVLAAWVATYLSGMGLSLFALTITVGSIAILLSPQARRVCA